MSNRNYESQILDAIQMLVDNAVSKANYDRTIKATISRCVDATIGKYVVKYQDSSFYAYSHNTDNTYSSGTMVYILIPGNDMSQDKSIIGTVDKLGIDYVSIIEGENGYEVTGVNAINSQIDFELNSYKSEDIKILYHRDNDIKLIDLDEFGFKTYMEQSNSIICGATFTTKLPTEQKTRGDYGIVFDLDFIDNATGETVTRSYMLNVDQMTGQPYNYTTPSRQYDIFEVDGSNFVSVKQVYIFAYDFPYTAEDKPNDIIVSKIELSAANALDKESAATAALTFITPKGVYFEDSHLDSEERVIEAQIRIKGQIVDNNSQDIKYYWFKENSSITNKNEKYNKIGGAGWECLNLFNVIQEASEDTDAIVEWISSSYHFITKKQDNIARETKYKCVAVYGEETVLTKTITIYNYSSDFNIEILSDSGTSFYYDIGNPTLTCYINGQEENGDEYSYIWSSIDNKGRFTRISETPEANVEYNNAISHLKQLEEQVAANEILTAAAQQEIQLYRNIVNQYEYVMRVERNKIHQLKVSTITNFTTYKCSVFKNGVGIGTASIIISNSLNNENNYSLVINNGNQVFKYNEDGLAPSCKALMNPISILPLTFTLYDKEGKSISVNSIGASNIKWKVPKDRTLIKCLDSYGTANSEDENYFIYTGFAEFGFSLYDVYNVSKDFNEILLEITYKKQIILAKTNFTFTKTGEIGTNHSSYICKIIPNIREGVAPKHPTLIYNETTNDYDVNYIRPTGEEKQWFKVQLWHGSEKILDTIQSETSTEGFEAIVNWSILQNDYGKDSEGVQQIDKSNFRVSSETAEFDFINEEIENPANIVKCMVLHNGIEHYATMPIIVSRIKDSSFSIDLKENTGFQYAIYNADGQKPQYDDKFPFDIYVTQIINGIKEPISLTEVENYKLTYDWNIRGNVYYAEWKPSQNLIERGSLRDDTKNQKRYRLSDTYNGLCVNNAVECIVSNKDGRIGSIHIPIHLYINRYGNAAMNGWDGNSISSDNEGGLILSPQVGAGSKNADGTFSGVFIGSIKEKGADKEEHGLFGYGSGQRTITLNSEDGSARFGKAGEGQIIIDPNSNTAQLKSGDYVPAKYDNQGNILESGSGMLIDLSEPRIEFGSGKFSVDKDGNVNAIGYATISDLTKVDNEIKNLEQSIKIFEVVMDTNSLLIPTSSERVPLTAASYEVNFRGMVKGQPTTDFTAELIEDIPDGFTVSLDNSKIVFITSTTEAIQDLVNTFKLKFSCTVEEKLYEQEQAISIALAIQGKDGEAGKPGEPGKDAEIPVTIKEISGTNLTINDGKKIIKYQVEGKSIQKTRSGKNKANASLDEIVENGLTRSADLGKIYLNGTETVEDKYLFGSTTLPAGTYTMCLQLISGTAPAMGFYAYVGTSWVHLGGAMLNEGNKFKNSVTFTIDAETVVTPGIYVGDNNIFDNVVVSYQIVSGSTADYDFEEFGAMPSPDYPSKVQSVGYENLFNDAVERKNAYVNTDIGSIVEHNNSNKSYVYVKCCYLKAGKTYTIKYNKNTPEATTARNSVIHDENNVILEKMITWQNDASKLSFTTTHSGWLDLCIDINATDIMITEGTKEFPYIPYGKAGIEVINTSKNLFDKNKEIAGKGIAVNTGNLYENAVWTVSDFIEVKNEIYTWSCKKINNSSQLHFAEYDANKQFIMISNENDVIITKQLNSNTKYIRVGYRNDLSTDVQLEVGSEATNYEPYSFLNSTTFLLNEPLRSLPNEIKDVAYLQNGKLHVERKVGSKIFNGSETWTRGLADEQYYFYSNLPNSVDTTTTNTQIFSNYFNPDKHNTKDGFYHYRNNIIIFNHDITNTLSEFQAWLSTHNTQVDYELATPIIEKYEPIYTIPMHEEATDIYYVNDELTPNTYCKYYTIYAGIDGETGKPGKDAEVPEVIKNVEGIQIVINDGKQINNFEIMGNSTQKTREGKNYYNYEDIHTIASGVTTGRDGWVTATFDNSTGTSEKYLQFFTNNLNINPNTKYSVILEIAAVSGTGRIHPYSDVNLEGQFPDGSNYQFANLKAGDIKIQQPTSIASFEGVSKGLRTVIAYSAGTSGSITFRLSVISSLSVTAENFVYEPYGVSPSPDYSSRIESIGYTNLFKPTLVADDGTAINQARCSVKIDKNTFKVTATGSDAYFGEVTLPSQGVYSGAKGYLMDVSNETSIAFKISNSRFEKNYITSYDKDLKLIASNEKRTSEGIHTLPKGTHYISLRFGVSNSVAGETYETTVQIIGGSQQRPFISYGKYGVEVIQEGKNKIKPHIGSHTWSGLTGTYDPETDTFNVKGTTTATGGIAFSVTDSKFKLKKGVAYTQSVITVAGIPNMNVVPSVINSKNVITYNYFNNNGTKIPTEDLTINTYNVYINAETGVAVDWTFKVQFEEGSVATEYEPYRQKSVLLALDQPLRGFKDGVKDKAYIKQGRLYVERKVGNVIMDGDESFLGYSAVQGDYFLVQAKYNEALPVSYTKYLMSNYFRFKENWGSSASRESIWLGGADGHSFQFKIASSRLESLDLAGFNKWLKTHPTEIIYELNTPFVEEVEPVDIPIDENLSNVYYINEPLDSYIYCEYGTKYAGLNGRSVYSVIDEYYVSTSKEKLIGGNWSEEVPTWVSGVYVWTRSKITYANPFGVVYTIPTCDSSWEAVNALEEDLQTQLDGKIQSYSQTSDPSTSWTTTELKTQHTGDLWYHPTSKITKRWSGTAWVTMESAEAQAANTLASKKAQIFTSQPEVPYYKGDLWITALDKTGVVKTCKTTRTSGSYNSSDWAEGLKYTDDSAVKDLEIGGRNLILKSDKWIAAGTVASGIANSLSPEGELIVTSSSGNGNWHSFSRENIIEENLKTGDAFTFSMEIKSDTTKTPPKIYFKSGMGYYSLVGEVGTEYSIVYYTGVWNDTNNIEFHFGWGSTEATYYIRKIKLEKGNKPTAWTPAPEDTVAEMDDLLINSQIEYCLSESMTVAPAWNDPGWTSESETYKSNIVQGTGYRTNADGTVEEVEIKTYYLWSRIKSLTKTENPVYSSYKCLVNLQKEITLQETEYLLSANFDEVPGSNATYVYIEKDANGKEVLRETRTWSNIKPVVNQKSYPYLWTRIHMRYRYEGDATLPEVDERFTPTLDTTWSQMHIITGALEESVARILGNIEHGFVHITGSAIMVGDDKDKPKNLIIISNTGIAFFKHKGNDSGWLTDEQIQESVTSTWTIDGQLNMQGIKVTNLVANSIANQNLVLGDDGAEQSADRVGDLDIYDKESRLIFETVTSGGDGTEANPDAYIEGFKIHKYLINASTSTSTYLGYIYLSRTHGIQEFNADDKQIFGNDGTDAFAAKQFKTSQLMITNKTPDNANASSEFGIQMIPMSVKVSNIDHVGVAFLKL